MQRLGIRIGFAAMVVVCAAAARGEEDRRDHKLFGEWRYIYSHAQDFPLNAAGEVSGLTEYLDQRLDVGVAQQVTDSLSFSGELEIFYGQVAGDFDRVGAQFRDDAREVLRGWDLKMAEIRQLWMQWNAPFFLLRVGQMGSHWGLGLLANDGRSQPGRFGFPDQGDLSDRVVFATRPFTSLGGWWKKVVTAVGGGVVFRDENASLFDGDVGVEMIASALYRDEGVDAGLYLTGRIQSDDVDTGFSVVAVDLSATVDAGVGHGGPYAAAELAFIAGTTDRVVQADHTAGLDVRSFGAVARGGWRFGVWNALPVLEVGFASGDPDPHDDTVTAFSFDPDYKVGLVLFDTVLRGITAMDAQESADPQRVGEPLRGTDLLPSRGRVSGVVYLYPTMTARPLEQLTLMAGFLVAWSSVPFAQSYQTFKNGGVSTNSYGLANAGQRLGAEIDLGADWNQKVWGQLRLVAGVQAGWFFPGPLSSQPSVIHVIYNPKSLITSRSLSS